MSDTFQSASLDSAKAYFPPDPSKNCTFMCTTSLVLTAGVATGLALFILSASVCAGGSSAAKLGSAFIAAGSVAAFGGVAFAYSQLRGDSNAKSRACKVLALTAFSVATNILLGVFTKSGAIPLKTVGWVIVGSITGGLGLSSLLGSSLSCLARSASALDE